VYKNQIFKEDRGDKDIVWEEQVMNSNEDKLAFLREELKIRVVILYCESNFILFLKDKVDYTEVNISLSTAQMRRLDKKEGDSYKLIVSDDPELLSRGLDFKGH
jgi:hypothetical protein